MDTLRVRAREIRPGDIIVEGWGGRFHVDRVFRDGDQQQWRTLLGSAGWADHDRESLTLGNWRMVAVRDWPESHQRFLPYAMDPSRRVTIIRQPRP